jgi:glycosyltransferase involved in cell wall biosynthesis
VQGILFGLHCFKLIFERWDSIEVDHMPYFPLYSTRIVCWLKQKKMYATWHEVWGRKYWMEYMGGFSGVVAYLIERFSIFLPDTFISVSQHTSERLQSVYGVNPARIAVCQNGLDTSTAGVVPAAKETCDIIYAGRLMKHKNVKMMIAAVEKLVPDFPKLTVTIVGNGPEKTNLIKYVENLGLQKNITFLSFLPHHHEVFSIMKSAKVFCLPSLREGFGLAVLEANACGIPALVVKHPENAAQDLIQEENGLVVEPTIDGMAKGLHTMLGKRWDSRAITRIASTYSWETIAQKVVTDISK